MTRHLLGTLAASVFCLSTAFATVSVTKGPALKPADIGPVKYAADPAPAPPGEFQITPTTEILLDGREVSFQVLPAGAVVTRVEVAADRRTVLRIEFRSPK